jgi:5-methylcytosine-specific restriction endonuclease McrA
MKRCGKCKLDLPLDEFHTDKRRTDGHVSMCKKCRAAWVASHKVEVAEYNARYYLRNREKRIREIHAYQKRHPEVQIKYRHQYRARKFKAPGTHTLADLLNTFKEQQGLCFYCGLQHASPQEGHFDHVIPLTRGGSDNPDNIVFACRACNWSKHDRTPDEWRRMANTSMTLANNATPPDSC